MSYTEKHIVDAYADLFEGLSSLSKIELIESFSKSLKNEKSIKETSFFKSFGAFSSKKSAEDIVTDIKSGRNFIIKELTL
jgi:uncharacterized protein YjfI (DUF2170 family)